MSNPSTITIGIPVYNVERYIEKCILSALNQSFDSYEIIVIDDFCRDKSIEIINSIKISHPKGNIIRIINHSHNCGVAEARNTILDNAEGKYIFFLDSDDYIEKDALAQLYYYAEKYDAEATYGSTFIINGNNKTVYKRYAFKAFIKEDEFATYIYSNVKSTIQTSAWNILLRTSHLRKHNLRFPNMRVGEDFFFVNKLFDSLEKVVLTDCITYNYVIRNDSLSNYQSRDFIDIREVKNALNRAQLLINDCKESENRKFFPDKCVYVMKQNIYVIFGILKHRHQLTEKISNMEIAKAAKHPAYLRQIIMFKRKKCTNLALLLFSKLPASFIIGILTYVGKKKGYITI